MAKIISPDEAIQQAQRCIPDDVFEAINELIAEKLDTISKQSTVKQDDVIERVCIKMGIQREQFDLRWLNVEDLYRNMGWIVMYDSPAYNETYNAFFKFSIPRRESGGFRD